MFISAGLEQYIFNYCKTRNAYKALISKIRQPHEKQMAMDCENSPKRLFSYIKRRTQGSD